MKAVILDDDPLILSLMGNLLHRRGFEVESYANPSLCPLYAVQGSPGQMRPPCPHVIITDFDMPNVNGIISWNPCTQMAIGAAFIALVSGSSIPPAILARAVKMNVKLFAKPFHVDQIRAWLDEIEPALRSGTMWINDSSKPAK